MQINVNNCDKSDLGESGGVEVSWIMVDPPSC